MECHGDLNSLFIIALHSIKCSLLQEPKLGLVNSEASTFRDIASCISGKSKMKKIFFFSCSSDKPHLCFSMRLKLNIHVPGSLSHELLDQLHFGKWGGCE